MQDTNVQRSLSELDLYVNASNSSKVRGWLNENNPSVVTEKIALKIKNKMPKVYMEYSFNQVPTKKGYTPHEESGKSFDEVLAFKYLNKLENAKLKGHEFTLSLTSMKNMLKAKKCYYTGLPLTLDTVTIDRVDNSKGYIRGNCVSCHTVVNNFKGLIENGTSPIGMKEVKMLMKKWENRL